MGRTTWTLIAAAVLAGAIWAMTNRASFIADDRTAGSASRLAAPAAGAAITAVSLPASLSPEAEIGKRVFEATCASCHGLNADGRNGAGPPLVHRTYEPSHHADIAFAMAVRNGVRAHHWEFGDMPPIEESLTDGEIGYVVRYVRELQRANGIE